MSSQDVVVVGSIHLDLIAYAKRVPGPGEALLGDRYLLVPGGKGGNQAIAAARQGARTAIVARVGADTFGDHLRNSLEQKAVDVQHLQTEPSVPTGLSPILVAENGQSATIIVPGAARTLTADHLKSVTPVLQSSLVLMLQREIADSTSAAAACIAKRAGATVIFNPSPLAHTRDVSFGELWREVDVLVVNEAEAAVLAETSFIGSTEGIRVAESLRARFGVSHVVVTLGARGAVIASVEGQWHVPGVKGPVVDAVGAGDVFAGALAAALARGDDLRAAMNVAVAAGGLAVQIEGAYDAAPTLSDAIAYAHAAI